MTGTTTENSYDKDGRLSATTDQEGNTTDYKYDAGDDLTSVTLPAVSDPNNGAQ